MSKVGSKALDLSQRRNARGAVAPASESPRPRAREREVEIPVNVRMPARLDDKLEDLVYHLKRAAKLEGLATVTKKDLFILALELLAEKEQVEILRLLDERHVR
jgi:ribosomal protein L2